MDRSLVSRYLPSINTAMYAFVTELAAEGVPDPPARELTFAALRDDLCRLAGEVPPPFVGRLLGTGYREDTRGLLVIAGPIGRLYLRLLAELQMEAIERRFAQPLPIGIVWADLRRSAGVEPSAVVGALRDAPVCC